MHTLRTLLVAAVAVGGACSVHADELALTLLAAGGPHVVGETVRIEFVALNPTGHDEPFTAPLRLTGQQRAQKDEGVGDRVGDGLVDRYVEASPGPSGSGNSGWAVCDLRWTGSTIGRGFGPTFAGQEVDSLEWPAPFLERGESPVYRERSKVWNRDGSSGKAFRG